jgi:nitric-oxide synthase
VRNYGKKLKNLLFLNLYNRNASRCVGRIQWTKLQLFDLRHVTNTRGMFDAICSHIRYAYNGGIIRSAITVFRQRTEPDKDFRIWNGQFFTYAGYENDDGSYIGDKAQVEFTKVCQRLGWKPKGEPTEFDVLPLVLQANGQDPEWFDLPEDLIYEIEINHPSFKWFNDLKLRWYTVPAVASMRLDIGGLEFTACPFNGW